MRDAETARIAIEASMTGHLVLSTLHTNSSAETAARLIELGIDPFSLSDALLAIVSQRLARKLCSRCRKAYAPKPEELDELAAEYYYCAHRRQPGRAERDQLLAQDAARRARALRRSSILGCIATHSGGTMLVKFDSKVGALTMFGDVAVELLKLMGHSGTVPSAILAPDISAALERLTLALDQGASLPATPTDEEDRREGRKPVSLRQRAYPLIDLLERAARNNADVMWERG